MKNHIGLLGGNSLQSLISCAIFIDKISMQLKIAPSLITIEINGTYDNSNNEESIRPYILHSIVSTNQYGPLRYAVRYFLVILVLKSRLSVHRPSTIPS